MGSMGAKGGGLEMEFKVESYGALCSLATFTINGKEAEEEEFVDKYDHDPDQAEPYGCGDMAADVIASTKEVLEKYNITEKEYQEIATAVAEEVSFGACGWCV